MRCTLIIVWLLAFFKINAQVGIGTLVPHNSAAFEIKDTAKGILIPRMTMLQRNAIATPAEGLMVYQTDNTKGYWYFDGVQWKNINTGNSVNNGGKQTIVLSGNITDQEAQNIITADFGVNTQEIKIIGCTNLTTVDLSMITTAILIEILDNSMLQTVNLQNLLSCVGDISIQGSPFLNSLDLSSLTSVTGEFQCLNTNITNLSLPALKKAKYLSIGYNNLLASISLPVFTSCRQFGIYNSNSLSAVSLPSLLTVASFYISNNNFITSVSFPALAEITDSTSSCFISNCQNLNSISLNSLSILKSNWINISGNNLPSSQVNYLLNKFVSISPVVTGKSFNLDQNIPPAPPTGQGIIDKATLESNGNTVFTD